MSLQRRTWEVLDIAKAGDRLSRAFDIGILVLIALNVVAVILETVPRLAAGFGAQFLWFERISVAVFSVEYVARLWSAPVDPRYRAPIRGRLRYMATPMAMVDLVAVLPFYLPLVGADLRFVRLFRLLRLFRIVKAARYVAALRLFQRVIVEKREELVLATCILLLLLVASASLMYFAENAGQPEHFSSIPAAMWWAASTITTVGYGDVYPITTLGRVLGALVAILGVGLFALPTAILGSGFITVMERSREPTRCPHCGGDVRSVSHRDEPGAPTPRSRD